MLRRREASLPQWVSGTFAIDEEFKQCSTIASLGSLKCTTQ